jgi:hypothetical protein
MASAPVGVDRIVQNFVACIMQDKMAAHLFADWSQRALAGEHHGRSAGTEPGIVMGAFGTDHTANGHEETR